ncbi:MAG: hypothetical protein EOO52_08775 [Gammaproteobacteria bacterium]|nr:MAG: hypothetical protein EOO52_08775 [Gammaproteobacteria bacterium]
MTSSVYEIVELPSGEIVLKRSDSDNHNSEPLVTLKFSEESIAFLGDARFEVAKVMIEAGMDAANELAEQNSEEITQEESDIVHHLLH